MTARSISTAKSSTPRAASGTRVSGRGRCRCGQVPQLIWNGSITCWPVPDIGAAVAGASGSPPVAPCATSPMRPLRPTPAYGLDSSPHQAPLPVGRSRRHLLVRAFAARMAQTDGRTSMGKQISDPAGARWFIRARPVLGFVRRSRRTGLVRLGHLSGHAVARRSPRRLPGVLILGDGESRLECDGAGTGSVPTSTLVELDGGCVRS